MRRQLVLAEFSRMIWALPIDRYDAYSAVMQRWARGAPMAAFDKDDIENDKETRESRRAAAGGASSGGIAVLPLYGVITQRGNAMDDLCGPGSVSTQMFSQMLRDAIADETVSAVLIDCDSPGGSVYGVTELADEIYSARSKKPVTAVANSLCASAAYWLCSQASEMFVTPGGETGSIGVIASHADFSKQNEMTGVKVTYITAGKYKSEGNPDEPLSDDALAYEQSRVNDYYSAFTKAIARGRGVGVSDVRDKMGEGRVFGADGAVAAKMADDILTFDQVVKRMRSQVKQSKGASSIAHSHAHLDRRIRISSQT